MDMIYTDDDLLMDEDPFWRLSADEWDRYLGVLL